MDSSSFKCAGAHSTENIEMSSQRLYLEANQWISFQRFYDHNLPLSSLETVITSFPIVSSGRSDYTEL
jgi:hypothetical protein